MLQINPLILLARSEDGLLVTYTHQFNDEEKIEFTVKLSPGDRALSALTAEAIAKITRLLGCIGQR